MDSFKRISIEQAKALMDQDNCQLADIRDEMSYQQGHIAGASHLGNHNLQGFIEQADPDAPLIIYCYHGNSSQSAAQYFIEKDFTEVYSMDGGFEMWRLNEPFTTGQ
ncbi:thiosulfate sulfurtransferase GlpE [Spongiibacter sp. KMU-158]|uniref:Thiosulfate sulfurtransferase GlpE n=1 Tax=Spongiibacter pelagi TaxID=2760804 RepID=A0A927C559_9GAMM|nr:thiosulfate sulfurtransferase GlpE [Spongiibacter pelagi]MBD2859766.1 thiosulfate sulfurtransferase GlpE [Spongiibacter pelagi]